MTTPNILVVDDDPNLLELMRMRLEASGYAVEASPDEHAARDAMGRSGYDIAIVDLQLVTQDGISLMEELHAASPDMPVIILTAHGSIESAVEAMQRGAHTYLTKPFDSKELVIQIERALEKRRLTSELKKLKALVHDRYDFENIVAKSDAMRQVLEQVHRIAKTDSNVLLYGESGTGKELIAKAVHLASDRSDKPYVAINCAAIPETLLESELFGHEKGAFTGAIRASKGLFTQADGGTVFLDEIGDMSLSLQAKFLRVLQERQFYPLGGDRPVRVDVRVIAATNKDLEQEVANGDFREDLYFRIHVIPIILPPLRERRDDIPPLVERFLDRYRNEMGKKIKGLSSDAMRRLLEYDWPGNVRELENALEYAVAMSRDSVITAEHILQTKSPGDEPLRPLKEARDQFERQYLIDILKITRGNVSRASELSGKYRADFYNLLRKHGLKAADFKKISS